MHRFYLPPEQCRSPALALTGREAHHASHVLRLRRNDQVAVLDGAGTEFLCAVAGLDREAVHLQVRDRRFTDPPSSPITLLQAVPKGKLMEWIIEKATELGAARIVPILSERVLAQLPGNEADRKAEKWQQVAIEAIKQCGAPWLPQIEPPVKLEEFLARNNPFELPLVASLQPGSLHPRECFEQFQARHGRFPKSVSIWIGPEGDFTAAELNLIQAAGAQPISLGPRVLRAETAAICALSLISSELQWVRP